MKLDWRLQEYLHDNGLSVELNEDRFEVQDKEGKVVCKGVTANTAILKAILLNTCPCQQYRVGPKRGVKK